MELSRIRERDIVEIDRGGRRFLATVMEKETGMLVVNPLKGENVSYRTATARQVVGHWQRKHKT